MARTRQAYPKNSDSQVSKGQQSIQYRIIPGTSQEIIVDTPSNRYLSSHSVFQKYPLKFYPEAGQPKLSGEDCSMSRTFSPSNVS